MIRIVSVLALAATVVAQPPGPPGGGGGQTPGGGAPTPAEGATECKVDGSSATYTIDKTSDADYVLVTSNGCPAHHFINSVGNNPNKAYTQDISLKIPKVPVIRSNASGYNTAIDTQMGTIGMSLSNVALFGPAVSPTGGDAGISEIDTFDCGEGHSTPTGHYHYHIAPYIIDRAQSSPASQHSPLYGFLVDGFPVYGPMGDAGTTPSDLDACGGHSGDGGGLGYHYHTNAPDGVVAGPGDETTTRNVKPYFASCFRGCVPDGMGGAQTESYADCLTAASVAPVSSIPSSASDLLTPLATTAYNYTGCPASFETELQLEEDEQNTVSAGVSSSINSMLAMLVVGVAAVILSP